MIEHQVQSVLSEIAEQKMPKAKINLWQGIVSRIVNVSEKKSKQSSRSETTFNLNQNRSQSLRKVTAISLVALLVVGLFFISPQGQGLAQNILRFFTRGESNHLPIQDFQKTPPSNAINPTSDPASIIYAEMSINEVQQQAAFKVFVPAVIPEKFKFSGASFDKESNSVRIFYQLFETNGLILRQELNPMDDTCILCGKIGADGAIQEVSINGIYGEYVEGVWKLTESGPVWEPDPYLKTMRWQQGEMAFELLYMGPPETLSLEEMIAIAKSIE